MRSSGFLKERLFGLSNPQGNHGESIKEAHFHLDNTPTVGAFRWILGLDSSEGDGKMLMSALAFLYEISLQVPPARVSLPRPDR